jgi:hypothetical protein
MDERDETPGEPPEPPRDIPPFEPDFDLIGKHDEPPKRAFTKPSPPGDEPKP